MTVPFRASIYLCIAYMYSILIKRGFLQPLGYSKQLPKLMQIETIRAAMYR